MTKIIIDTVEGRDIAMFDITGVYLHAYVPNEKRLVA